MNTILTIKAIRPIAIRSELDERPCQMLYLEGDVFEALDTDLLGVPSSDFEICDVDWESEVELNRPTMIIYDQVPQEVDIPTAVEKVSIKAASRQMRVSYTDGTSDSIDIDSLARNTRPVRMNADPMRQELQMFLSDTSSPLRADLRPLLVMVGTDAYGVTVIESPGGGKHMIDTRAKGSIDALPAKPRGDAGTSHQAAREDHVHPMQVPSRDAGNSMQTGSDGRHYFRESVCELLLGEENQLIFIDERGEATEVDLDMPFSPEGHAHAPDGVSADHSNALRNGTDGKPFMSAPSASLKWVNDLGVLRFVDPTGTARDIRIAGTGAQKDFFLRGDGRFAAVPSVAPDYESGAHKTGARWIDGKDVWRVVAQFEGLTVDPRLIDTVITQSGGVFSTGSGGLVCDELFGSHAIVEYTLRG